MNPAGWDEWVTSRPPVLWETLFDRIAITKRNRTEKGLSMSDVTKLYDGAGCHGFVKRKDGFWWIRDGALTSMSDAQGKRLERLAHTVFLNERTPALSECLGYITARWKHQAACLLHALGKRLG